MRFAPGAAHPVPLLSFRVSLWPQSVAKAEYRHCQAAPGALYSERCGSRTLRPHAALLHIVLFCTVPASRYAKASLCVGHRFAPSRVYKTHNMQSGLRWPVADVAPWHKSGASRCTSPTTLPASRATWPRAGLLLFLVNLNQAAPTRKTPGNDLLEIPKKWGIKPKAGEQTGERNDILKMETQQPCGFQGFIQ